MKRELAQVATKASWVVRWFKTGKGEYGEEDKFIGVSVPKQRAVATKFRHLELDEIEKLLESRIHEYRYIGLLILVGQYETGDAASQQRVFEFYLKHTRCVNNWDLVDTSAPYIVGEYLARRSRRVLYRLAKSSEWWERRIAMMATAAFIDREAILKIRLRLRLNCSPISTTSSIKRLAGCYGKRESIREHK